jgi:pyruvate dehydrogenase E2 component (dihydrolipoamide acetyltransferase)
VPRTGRRGQVTSDDLRRHLERQAAAAPSPPPDAAPVVVEVPGERDAPTTMDRKRAALRAATAKVVTRSAAIPQFTLHRAIDLTRAAVRRQGRTWTTEIVVALATALRAHPELNARWDDEAARAVPIDRVRIGLAVAVPAGLVVVGLDDPDRITPTHANEHVLEVVDRARSGALDSADVEGVTFTVSNLGGFGVDAFDALLMPPQAGILSVGRVAERPVVVDGHVRPRLQVDVGLTVDHRVADGADGATLLATFADALEA